MFVLVDCTIRLGLKESLALAYYKYFHCSMDLASQFTVVSQITDFVVFFLFLMEGNSNFAV